MSEDPAPGLQLEPLVLKKAGLHFRAINHPLRLEMLQVLHKGGRTMVTDIYVKLKLEQSVASQHLAVLRKAKLVITEREGKRVYYSINYPQLKQLEEVAQKLAGK